MVLDDKAFLGYNNYSMLYLNLCNEEPPLISLTINRILLEGSSLLLTSIFLNFSYICV